MSGVRRLPSPRPSKKLNAGPAQGDRTRRWGRLLADEHAGPLSVSADRLGARRLCSRRKRPRFALRGPGTQLVGKFPLILLGWNGFSLSVSARVWRVLLGADRVSRPSPTSIWPSARSIQILIGPGFIWPKGVANATSAASRPIPIRTKPSSAACRVPSNSHQRPPR